MQHTRCVIVGGGPAGLVAALILARGGVEVTLLEKHGDFLRDFRGDTVHPSTLTLLDELGLGEKFAALPHSRLTHTSLPDGHGGMVKIADLSLLKVPHPYNAMVPQWDLLALLAESARKEPSFTLRLGTEVTGLLRSGARVSGVRYRTAEGTEGELGADLVIAADGRWSVARRAAGLEPKEFATPFDAWWFRLPRPEAGGEVMVLPRMGRRRFVIPIPRRDYFQVAYFAPKGEDLRHAGIESFRRGVVEACPEFAGSVAALESMDDVKFLDIRLNRLHRWHVDGLLCLGDAAHAMSPVAGVGINLAVQDAVAAATLLARPLRYGRVSPRQLARVRTRRLLPTVAVQKVQQVMHTSVMRPVMLGRREGPSPRLVKLLRRFPKLAYWPARLMGVGFRPEHAPGFARRSPEPA